MKAIGAPVWAVSFADLCLLLLGFFVMLHAQSRHQAEVVQGIKQALGGRVAAAMESHDIVAARMFEPGEAVLRRQALEQVEAIGRHAAARNAKVRIESIGLDPAARRFDGWELAAARTAALARAVQMGGLPEKSIIISIPEMAADTGQGQRIAIELVPLS